MANSSANMSIFSWQSWPSIGNILSLMVCPTMFLHCASMSLQMSGTFEYAEYISLKSINDPNEGYARLGRVRVFASPMLTDHSYETISDLMTLQDQIDSFQKLVFSHFRSGSNNECRISALVPLVQETHGIYKFITSMLRAMHSSMSWTEYFARP